MTSDWEIGNTLKNNAVDALLETYKETKKTHPDLADVLYHIAGIVGYAANNLCDDGADVFESKSLQVSCYRILGMTANKYWWERETSEAENENK